MGSLGKPDKNANVENSGSVRLGSLRRAASTSTTTSIGTQASETTDGCIVLGQDGGRGNKYITRFRIRRDLQLKSVTGHICKEECFPCMEAENRESFGTFLWTLVNSEPLLLFLHLSAVILGAVKEGLQLKIVAEDLHITASTIETYVALQILVTRIVGAWQGLKSLNKTRKTVEYIDTGGEISHSPRLKNAVKVFTVFGVFLCLVAMTAYGLFFYFDHLTWTILSNNFVIIMITASSGLLMGRIGAEMTSISEDHHKAVIYESMLLLTECVYSNKRDHMVAKIDRFCKALNDTTKFAKPDYIDIPSDQRFRSNLMANLQLQSFV